MIEGRHASFISATSLLTKLLHIFMHIVANEHRLHDIFTTLGSLNSSQVCTLTSLVTNSPNRLHHQSRDSLYLCCLDTEITHKLNLPCSPKSALVTSKGKSYFEVSIQRQSVNHNLQQMYAQCICVLSFKGPLLFIFTL